MRSFFRTFFGASHADMHAHASHTHIHTHNTTTHCNTDRIPLFTRPHLPAHLPPPSPTLYTHLCLIHLSISRGTAFYHAPTPPINLRLSLLHLLPPLLPHLLTRHRIKTTSASRYPPPLHMKPMGTPTPVSPHTKGRCNAPWDGGGGVPTRGGGGLGRGRMWFRGK